MACAFSQSFILAISAPCALITSWVKARIRAVIVMITRIAASSDRGSGKTRLGQGCQHRIGFGSVDLHTAGWHVQRHNGSRIRLGDGGPYAAGAAVAMHRLYLVIHGSPIHRCDMWTLAPMAGQMLDALNIRTFIGQAKEGRHASP